MGARGDLGARLEEAIRASGKSQKWLGTELGISQASVSEWVRGISMPGADRLGAIVGLLEVNGHWLLTGKGPMEPPGEDYELERERATARRQLAEKLIQAVGKVVREAAEEAGVATSPGVGGGLVDRMDELAANDEKIRRAAAKQGKGTKKRA